jgi:hypothetical protein
MHYKEILAHVTGVSPWGIQWKPIAVEITTARNLLRLLEDRRVLYQAIEMEGPAYCLASVERMREKLTRVLQEVNVKSPFGKDVAKLRRASRKFCDIVGNPGFDGLTLPIQKSILARELAKLRKVAGSVVAGIAINFKLDVEDELASIMPLNAALRKSI